MQRQQRLITAWRAPHRDSRKPRRPEAGYSPCRNLDWRAATPSDLERLHPFYLAPEHEPFFVDISGPTPGMELSTFVDWCRDDAAMWMAWRDGAPVGFMWFSYLQSSIGVADVDWGFFSGDPKPDSPEAGAMRACFDRCCRDLRLRKVHLRALSGQGERLLLAKSFGFIREGVLHEQFFHRGELHDLVCLGFERP